MTAPVLGDLEEIAGGFRTAAASTAIPIEW
jgi:hypothetical protein